MKKFCSKLTNKQEWRLTMPNLIINRKIDNSNDEIHHRKSGSYDLEQAQREYDRTRSIPSSVYIESDTSSTSSDCVFEDARASHKTSQADGDESKEDLLDTELYADVVHTTTSQNITNSNSVFHYDVPKISFSFFDPKNNKKEEEEIEQENTYENEVAPILKKSEVKIVLTQPPPIIAIIKSGSDPNINIEEQDDDDGFYKVPKDLNRCRFSQSLHDFNEDDEFHTTIISTESIEHVSCSQVLVEELPEDNTSVEENKKSSRLNIFRKPPRKAVDTWNNFRMRFNNIIQEQAAQQRVGAYSDKDRIVINFEEVYKNSKSKCRNAFKSTTKLFKKSPNRNRNLSVDSTGDSSDQIVKNDALNKVLTNKDIQYKFDQQQGDNKMSYVTDDNVVYVEGDEKKDFMTIRSAFRWNKMHSEPVEGQNGFDDLRRYVKQGGDFCKELAIILQERAETEAQYAKNLSKLSAKLSKACRDGVGSINEAWKAVAIELETRAEIHRMMGQALLEETAKPLRNLTENQHRTRKQCETTVDKAAKNLADWRTAEAKGKKQSHSCARDNEKLQDAAVLDTSRSGKLTLSRSTSFIQLAHKEAKNNTDKENAKLEGKKKKAEDAVKKADIEYYTLCVKAERARLEWESAVLRGVNTFQSLEEERLNNLKVVLNSYLRYQAEQGPRLIEITEKMKTPIDEAQSCRDLTTFVNLRQSSQQVAEQLLPDFYCEHITLAMNRERRKQALVKLLHLIRQDIERERKSKNGLEKLSKAIKQTPNFGAEDSQQSVSEKLYHMKSMLTYLEGARYKIQNALAELDSKPRSGHPLQPHITITRDKSGLQQSILKVPQWLREDWLDGEKSPVSEKSVKSHKSDNSDPHNNDIADSDWNDRGAADGNSNQPDSDFDEFSSQCSSSAENHRNNEDTQAQPIAQCKALYAYIPKLSDELALQPGDYLSVYQQQDDGWWFGECRGNYGTFPATYVELINSN